MRKVKGLATKRDKQNDEIRLYPFRHTSLPLSQLLFKESIKDPVSKRRRSKTPKNH